MQLRSEGKTTEANLVKKAIFTTDSTIPICSRKINATWNTKKNNITPYTPREALAYMLDTDMSKASFHLTRMQAKSRGADLYPSYDKVKEAKRKCYPSTDFIIVTTRNVRLDCKHCWTIRSIESSKCKKMYY